MQKAFWSNAGNLIVKRKAMKFHGCDECGCSIIPNEEYYNITYEDGDTGFHTAKICERCWSGNPLSSNNPKKYGDADNLLGCD